jgi:CDP-glucose 4,6-dehydratase
LPPASISLFEQATIADGMTSIYGNILDTAQLHDAIKQCQPDIVFHLAAQPLVHYSYQNPAETYTVNVIGTVNVLEAIRAVENVRATVVVTSDKCYENQEWVWGYRETDAMGGFDPYSSSKGCAELVVSAYRRSYFNVSKFDQHRMALASARAGNVIGGGDWAEARLIPDLVRSFSNKQVATIRNPHACRPWQYILDLLQGYLILAERLWDKGTQFADAWNFGPHEENVKPVFWIADKVADLWKENAKWALGDNPVLHEAMSLRLDCNKSRTLLGWEPKMSIDDSLKHTLAWYAAHHHHADMNKFTEQQIREYAGSREIN